MSTFSIFLILILIVAFLLVLVIMVQNPKGGGLSSSFGGGQQIVGGVKKTGDFLDKSTWTLATVLIVLILLSNMTLKTGSAGSESKILEGENIENVAPETETEGVLEVTPESEAIPPAPEEE